MGWSIKLGTIGGTAIFMHATFLLLLAWIGTALWLERGAPAALDGVLFVIAVFICVVLHELGHAFAAQRYGIGTRSITLLPIGGLAALDRMPDAPSQEIVVALAGPAVNVLIAGLLVTAFGAQLDPASLGHFGAADAQPASRLATINLSLAIFNMIPAFPMDGGRVLRALLGFALPHPQATEIAARVGQGLAIALGFLGLLGNPMLVLIAVFVFLAASTEAYSVTLHDFARGRPVTDAMIVRFEPLSSSSTLDDAARLLLATTQLEFPVLDENARLSGFLTRHSLIEGLATLPGDERVTRLMTSDVPVRPSSATLDSIVDILEATPAPAVGIVSARGEFAGYVTLEGLAEFFMIRQAGNRVRDRSR